MQCGNHICSVIHVKYMYSAHCHMVDCSDFTCGKPMHIHIPNKSVNVKHLAYMPKFVGTFVCSIYLAKKSVCIAGGSFLVQVSKNIGSICPFNTLVV